MQKRITIYYECEDDDQSRSFERELLNLLGDATVVQFQEMQVDSLTPTRGYLRVEEPYNDATT